MLRRAAGIYEGTSVPLLYHMAVRLGAAIMVVTTVYSPLRFHGAVALILLVALVLLACTPAQDSAPGGPVAATPGLTGVASPILTPATSLPAATAIPAATDLPMATAAPAATNLPAATSITVSPEGIVGTVDAEQAAQARQKYERLLRATWKTDFSKATIPFDEIITGGPPKDGIPSIDKPSFESVADADEWLSDLEAVQVVDLNGDVRAYPVQVMVWHELVNDTVGGEPVVITF